MKKRNIFLKVISITMILTLIFLLGACNNKNEDTIKPSSESNTSGETVPTNATGNTNTTAPTVPTERESVTVTLPEGYTMVRMAWALRDAGVCDADALIKAAQEGNYSEYPFVTASKNTSNVCFPLEGYLFPATYEFYKNEDPVQVWKKILNTTQEKYAQEVKDRASANGLSLHQLITLASVVEKEGKTSEQRKMIAGILYNRLRDGMPLQCDATIDYVKGVIWEIYPSKEDYKYHYNTYRTGALPAGPICNPGMDALNAAMYPAKTDYMYFVVRDYEIRYAKDYETHNKNMDELGIVIPED